MLISITQCNTIQFKNKKNNKTKICKYYIQKKRMDFKIKCIHLLLKLYLMYINMPEIKIMSAILIPQLIQWFVPR